MKNLLVMAALLSSFSASASVELFFDANTEDPFGTVQVTGQQAEQMFMRLNTETSDITSQFPTHSVYLKKDGEHITCYKQIRKSKPNETYYSCFLGFRSSI